MDDAATVTAAATAGWPPDAAATGWPAGSPYAAATDWSAGPPYAAVTDRPAGPTTVRRDHNRRTGRSLFPAAVRPPRRRRRRRRRRHRGHRLPER